ncbi:thioredoxin, mitochondrial [Drosophila mojavensis]|uniref:Thioredoxin domain-containing protein n=1 Tax=Drosophila mojavensis TaxID=7230 RepID=B4KRL1_DROMO|nr:thioredoxin, mitochondrial [Drosophila mojavensis]EDW10437.1 uncharacterized protein Dmoj_GI21084 [Drosophila mojavensis]
MSLNRNSIQIKLLKSLLNSRKTIASRTIFDVSNLSDFEKKVRRSKRPVLVNFYASWCTPCKALMPRLKCIINEQRGNMEMARIDIDELTDLALSYNVGTVPSILIMHKGQELNRLEGLQPSEQIRNWLATVIKESAPDCIFVKK